MLALANIDRRTMALTTAFFMFLLLLLLHAQRTTSTPNRFFSVTCANHYAPCPDYEGSCCPQGQTCFADGSCGSQADMRCLESQGESPCGIGTAAGCCARGARCDAFGRCIAVRNAGNGRKAELRFAAVVVLAVVVGVWHLGSGE
ncbi:hypothetical protein FN846DRAFT_945745, partial [Sphaerosporella brunnea]